MNSLKNSVQLIGNLGNDPQVKHLDSGRIVANLSIATSDKYKNKEGEKIEETQWHDLVIWGKTAEIAEKYLRKGSKIAVEGKLTHRSFDDKEGNKRYVTEILVNELLMLGDKREN